jgi:TolB-like protein
MKWLVVPFVVLLAGLASAEKGPDKVAIAVNDLGGEGIDQSSANIISDRLRTELFKTGVVTVVDRQTMLEAFKVGASGQEGCTSDQCLAQMGQRLGVSQFVSGTVGKLGEVFTINVRVVDVATAKVVSTESVDCECPVSKVLTSSAPELAGKIAAGVGASARQAPAPADREVGVASAQVPADGHTSGEVAEASAPSSSTKPPAAPVNGGPTLVAVVPLKGQGVSDADALTLTDRLRIELFKTGMFSILERDEMERILKEQGFQQTGCTDQSCAVEMGRLLNAKQIVTGSIGKMGNRLYQITVRRVDVQSAAIVSEVYVEEKGAITDLLGQPTTNVARQLAGLKPDNNIYTMGVGACFLPFIDHGSISEYTNLTGQTDLSSRPFDVDAHFDVTFPFARFLEFCVSPGFALNHHPITETGYTGVLELQRIYLSPVLSGVLRLYPFKVSGGIALYPGLATLKSDVIDSAVADLSFSGTQLYFSYGARVSAEYLIKLKRQSGLVSQVGIGCRYIWQYREWFSEDMRRAGGREITVKYYVPSNEIGLVLSLY